MGEVVGTIFLFSGSGPAAVGVDPIVHRAYVANETNNTVSVNFATSNVTAIAGVGGDYIATSGTVSFAPGITTAAITVLVNGNLLQQPNRLFLVKIPLPQRR